MRNLASPATGVERSLPSTSNNLLQVGNNIIKIIIHRELLHYSDKSDYWKKSLYVLCFKNKTKKIEEES